MITEEQTEERLSNLLADKAGFGINFSTNKNAKTMLNVAVEALATNKSLTPLKEYIDLKENVPTIPHIIDFYDGTTEHVNREGLIEQYNTDKQKYENEQVTWSAKMEIAERNVEKIFGDVDRFDDADRYIGKLFDLVENDREVRELLMDSQMFHLQKEPDKELSKTFSIEVDQNTLTTVDLTFSQETIIDRILAELNRIKEMGFDYISLGKQDYTVDTYTDAESSKWVQHPSFFILSKEKDEIRSLDKSNVIEEDPYNSIREIVQGTSYDIRSVDELKNLFENKHIFIYPIDPYSFDSDNVLKPSELKDFLEDLYASKTIADYKKSLQQAEDREINKGVNNNSLTHKSSSIMANQEKRSTRQKADIDLKIELPNSEKPFFEKKSTENNMFNQIKKAGSKLDDTQQLNLTVNGKAIELNKTEILNPDLKEIVSGKISPKAKEKATANTADDQKSIPMDKNLEYLKDQIKYLGFGESPEVHKVLEQKIKEKSEGFSIGLQSDKGMFKNEVSHLLYFNKSKNSDTVFFNTFSTYIRNRERDVDINHTFAVKNKGFTAKESINLLEGRAVKTEIKNKIDGDKMEPAFVKLKLDEAKNEHGNYKMQVYNERYGVDTANIVDRFQLKFKDDKHKRITLKSLEKGNIVAVRFNHENKEVEGKAILNPQYKSLNLYDKNMKRLKVNAPSAKADNSHSNNAKAQKNYSRKM